MNIFLKIARLLYRNLKYFINIILWTPILMRFYIKSHKDFFDIFTHLTKKERLLLYKLGLSLPNKAVVVEIGSYLGASAVFLASAMKERKGHVYCVDTWTNEGMSEGKRNTYDEFLKNTKPLKDFISPLKGCSVDVAKTFNKRIDLLFIDGDHSYEAVKLDAEHWVPKVKDNGIVVFHDIGWADGVKRVVAEYIKPIQIEGHIVENTYWAKIRKK